MNAKKENHRAGFVSLLGSAFFFSLLGIAIRYFGQYFENLSQAAMRQFATLVVLLVFMLIRSEKFKFSWKETNKIAFAVYCLSGITATLFFIISAMQIKVANTVFYLYVASFIAAFIVGTTVFRERITKNKAIALTIAIVGLVIFSHPIDTNLSWGMLFGILAGVSDTLHFTSQKYLKNINRHTLLFYSYIVGLVILFTIAMGFGEQLRKPFDLGLLVAIPLFGVIFLALAETLLYGFNNYPLNLGTIVVSGELFFALFVNAIALQEIPTILEVIGAILIFVSIIIVNIDWSVVRQKLEYSHQSE